MKYIIIITIITVLNMQFSLAQVITEKFGDVTINKGLNNFQSGNKNGDATFIIKFSEPCYLESKTNVDFYLNRKNDFLSDINAIVSKNQKGFTELSQLKEFYYKSFFGAAIHCNEELIKEIENIYYVDTIYRSHIFKANLTESLDLLNIPQAWQEFNVQGDSIKVGIFDTGIDWNHPDLGGGFGQGYKVIDGRNFTDPYSSPMDDHGHGTHVAGIVAADGIIKGAAPKALLYACKVLNNEGSGYDWNILAAIEYAVDPNNDNNTEDKLDIVNMSFGSIPYENDPLPIAITNAINEGVIFCIAAGNESNYYSISSPGITNNAITVGSVDKTFEISESSSKGPTDNYTIKPDIVAIGENVNSTFLNSIYESYSGTSMSTPMVSGACALLKQLHPEWTPYDIKSALVNTSTKINNDIMSQGGGIMNLVDAAQVSTTITPALLNFGKINENSAIWQTSQSIKIQNHSGTEKSYEIEISGNQSGIMCFADTNMIQIPAHKSAYLTIKLKVDNNLLLPPQYDSQDYSENIIIKSADDTLMIPWACVKPNIIYLDIKFPDLPDMDYDFYLFNEKKHYDTENLFFVNDTLAQINVIPGNYNFLARMYMYDSIYYTIINENIELTGSDTIQINYTEAKNKVEMKGVDENGNLFSSNTDFGQRAGVMFDDTLYSLLINMGMHKKEINFYISDFHQNTTLFTYEYLINEKDKTFKLVFYEPLSALYSDTVMVNNQNDMIEQTIDLRLRKDIQNHELVIFQGLARYDHFHQFGFGFDGSVGIYNPLNNQFNFKVVMNSNNFERLSTYYHVGYNEIDYTFYERAYPIRGYNSGISVIKSPKPYKSTYLSPSKDTLQFGNGLVQITSQFNNEPGKISISNKLIKGLNEETRNTDYLNSIRFIKNTNGDIIYNNSFYESTDLDVETGIYTIHVIDTSYFVNGVQGKAELINKVDLSKIDKNPPVLSLIDVRNPAGKPISSLAKSESGDIFISTYDVTESSIEMMNADSLKVFYKYYDSKEWNALSIEGNFTDSLYDEPYRIVNYCHLESNITNYDSTAIDIKVMTSDASGNTLEYILEPAVAIGKMQAPFLYPIATVDTFYVKENYTLEVEKEDGILINDEGEVPFNLYASLSVGTSHGDLDFSHDGSFLYKPDTLYVGQDQFFYFAHNQTEELKSQLTKAVIIVEEDNAIDEIFSDNILVYPNPFSTEIIISNHQLDDPIIQLKVYNVKGEEISTLKKPNSSDLHFSNNELKIFEDGVYFIELQGNGKKYIVKVNYVKCN